MAKLKEVPKSTDSNEGRIQEGVSIKDRLWIKGLFSGHDYVLTDEEILDIELVSKTTMILIVAATILICLLIGGIIATVAFFVPVVVAPSIVEFLAYERRRPIRDRLDEVHELELRSKKIKWGTVKRIEFEGGIFTFSTSSEKRKFRGLIHYSDVRNMANYMHSTGKVSDVVIRKIDWVYALGSLFLTVVSYFLLTSVPSWVIEIMILCSIGLITVFFIKLLRAKPVIIR